MAWRRTSAGFNNVQAIDVHQCALLRSTALCTPMQRLMFGLIAAGVATLAGASQASEPAGVDAPELIHLVRQDCGSCHGMTLQGGLGTPLTREALVGQSAEALAVIILHGKHGTAMPPWKTQLSAAQAQWIAERLLEGFPEERPQ
jgi:cytochrome c55X